MSTITGNQNIIYTFFARKPIFYSENRVFGYELKYRSDTTEICNCLSNSDIVNISVITAALSPVNNQYSDDPKIFICIPSETIRSGMPASLCPATTIIELDDTQINSDNIIENIIIARDSGYRVAISADVKMRDVSNVVNFIDYLFVSMHDKSEEELKALASSLSGSNVKLAARRVEDHNQFLLAKRNGFQLFQGSFFKRPIISNSKNLSSNKLTRFKIYQSLANSKLNTDELVAIIESDVSICYRLLTLINSIAFGIQYKVESIKHAIMLLGWEQIKNWLWLIVLSDAMPKTKSMELLQLSAIRAKFMETAAARNNYEGAPPETLFLLGIFSLLEPILDTPMSELVEKLPLNEGVKSALCGHNNTYYQWLELSRCFESGNWSKMESLIMTMHLDPVSINKAYCESLTWVNNLYDQSGLKLQ